MKFLETEESIHKYLLEQDQLPRYFLFTWNNKNYAETNELDLSQIFDSK